MLSQKIESIVSQNCSIGIKANKELGLGRNITSADKLKQVFDWLSRPLQEDGGRGLRVPEHRYHLNP